MQAEENDIFSFFLRRRLGLCFHFTRKLRRPLGRGWFTRVALSCVTAVAFAFTQGPGSTQKTETPEVLGTFSTRYFCRFVGFLYFVPAFMKNRRNKRILQQSFLRNFSSYPRFAVARMCLHSHGDILYISIDRKERTQYTTKVFWYMYTDVQPPGRFI